MRPDKDMQQTIMSHISMRIAAIGSALIFVFAGCTTKLYTPDLGGLYNELVQNEDPYRNPVIVIPGILGSKLRDADSGGIVWGAFGPGSANPKRPHGARLIALPMREGTTLNDLRDNVHSDGALDRVRITLLGLRLQLKAYFYILSTLGVPTITRFSMYFAPAQVSGGSEPSTGRSAAL